jgi:hypothetical protein
MRRGESAVDRVQSAPFSEHCGSIKKQTSKQEKIDS